MTETSVGSELDALALTLGVPEFDLMLVGDGSGSTAGQPCGWAVTCYDRLTGAVKLLGGGTSGGTNNYAELAPYLQALWAYSIDSPDAKPRVLIVSDSELTVRCGEGRYARRANLALWASIDHYAGRGWEFFWRHVRRNSNRFSATADRVANRYRLAMAGLSAEE